MLCLILKLLLLFATFVSVLLCLRVNSSLSNALQLYVILNEFANCVTDSVSVLNFGMLDFCLIWKVQQNESINVIFA